LAQVADLDGQVVPAPHHRPEALADPGALSRRVIEERGPPETSRLSKRGSRHEKNEIASACVTPSESFNEVSSAVSDTPASAIETNQTTFLVLAAKTVCRKPYGETAGDFKANSFDESTLELGDTLECGAQAPLR